MKKVKPELTEEERAELDAEMDALALLPDDGIDTSDISEIVDRSKSIRGFFYRPEKREIWFALDDFVIDWFKGNSGGGRDFDEYINEVLLEHIRRHCLRELREAEGR